MRTFSILVFSCDASKGLQIKRIRFRYWQVNSDGVSKEIVSLKNCDAVILFEGILLFLNTWLEWDGCRPCIQRRGAAAMSHLTLRVRKTNESVTLGNLETLKTLLRRHQLHFSGGHFCKVTAQVQSALFLRKKTNKKKSVAAASAMHHFSRRFNSVWRKCHLTFPLRRDPNLPNLPAYITSLFSVWPVSSVYAHTHKHRHTHTHTRRDVLVCSQNVPLAPSNLHLNPSTPLVHTF